MENRIENDYLIEDIILVCKDCKKDFVWTKGQQLFLISLNDAGKLKKGIGIKKPTRCYSCRIERDNYFKSLEQKNENY